MIPISKRTIDEESPPINPPSVASGKYTLKNWTAILASACSAHRGNMDDPSMTEPERMAFLEHKIQANSKLTQSSTQIKKRWAHALANLYITLEVASTKDEAQGLVTGYIEQCKKGSFALRMGRFCKYAQELTDEQRAELTDRIKEVFPGSILVESLTPENLGASGILMKVIAAKYANAPDMVEAFLGALKLDENQMMGAKAELPPEDAKPARWAKRETRPLISPASTSRATS